MDRDELIARLRSEANAMEKGLNARLSRDAQFVRCREADTMREAAAALESRPAPTEQRARAIMAEEAEANGYPLAAASIRKNDDPWFNTVMARAMIRFATDTTPSRPDLEALNDPNAVHVNMLRGGIARPSYAQIWHIYGAALAEDMPDDVRATLAPSRDEEGSVDREDALAHWLATAEKHKLMVASKPGRADWPATEAVIDALMTFAALKASTTETQTVERPEPILEADHTPLSIPLKVARTTPRPTPAPREMEALQPLCAEIVQWWDSGVLKGDLLKEYGRRFVSSSRADEHDFIRQAERDVVHKVIRLVSTLNRLSEEW